MEGIGQFVEITQSKDEKLFKIGLLALEGKKWIIVLASE
jgi:hypothetical protein